MLCRATAEPITLEFEDKKKEKDLRVMTGATISCDAVDIQASSETAPALTGFALAMKQQLLDANASARLKVERHRPGALPPTSRPTTGGYRASNDDDADDDDPLPRSSWDREASSRLLQQQQEVCWLVCLCLDDGWCVCVGMLVGLCVCVGTSVGVSVCRDDG
jgi:hypothetical protein